ncbi:MAG: DUF3883 domain-containing protein [Mesorhizobium sp.]|nr:MAG: DUF3883 domain-containing protein [Mesorhizobium sp.]
MRDLPSRGRCHAVFLLAYSARVRRCGHIDAWLRSAAEKPTHMAASLDLVGTARLLTDTGLVRADGGVVVSRELTGLDQVADLTTLKGIARLLLVRRPPDWLRTAVVDGRLAPEFIPSPDLEAMSWIGPELEPIVVSAHHHLYATVDDTLLKRLGDAGELAVMSALQCKGLQPRHVALISDRFGYDIELDTVAQRQGLEIKTAVRSTAARILISRHEFEVARRMGERWKIVQVTFSTKVIARGVATASDIEAIRELSSARLVELAPMESSVFRWVDTAEFRPHASMWSPSDLVIATNFTSSLDDS